MRGRKILKALLTLAVVLSAGAFFMRSSVGESIEYYKHVDEVVGDPLRWQGKRIQLHGYVVPGSIMRKRDGLEYRFVVQSNNAEMTAFYSGIVPDTFKDDAEVVLKGMIRSDGFHVDPNGVMAKCPSKYESRIK